MKSLLTTILLLITINCYSQDTAKIYCFDGITIRKIAEDKLELNYLRSEKIIWGEKDSIYKRAIQVMNTKLCLKEEIILSLERQIIEMEKQPIEIVEKINWSFVHTVFALIVSSLSVWLGSSLTK